MSDRRPPPKLSDDLPGWVMTRSGKRFRPLAPRPKDIDIADIACGLSRRFRFCGQTTLPYTVAQHSVSVSLRFDQAAPPRGGALWGLLHDASEAWLPDAQRHIKPLMYFLREVPPWPLGAKPPLIVAGDFEQFAEVERRILQAVAARFDLPWPMPEGIKYADDRELAREVRDLYEWDHPTSGEVTLAEPPYDERISPWPVVVAEEEFLERFRELRKQS